MKCVSPGGCAEKEESTTAEIASLGMDDGEGESGGDGGVDGVASGLHDFYPGARGQFVNAGHDGVRRMASGAAERRRGWR